MKSNPWMMYEFRSKDWQRQSVVLLQIVFDIEQLNFEDTNKFPDWRLTVDVDVERFRAQYVRLCSTLSLCVNVDASFCFQRLQDEHFWTRMFNVNRLVHLCEWWTEPNAQKVQTDLMKHVRLHCSSRLSICTMLFPGSTLLLENKPLGCEIVLSSLR